MWPQRGGDPQAENHCPKQTLEKAQCVTSTVNCQLEVGFKVRCGNWELKDQGQG